MKGNTKRFAPHTSLQRAIWQGSENYLCILVRLCKNIKNLFLIILIANKSSNVMNLRPFGIGFCKDKRQVIEWEVRAYKFH